MLIDAHCHLDFEAFDDDRGLGVAKDHIALAFVARRLGLTDLGKLGLDDEITKLVLDVLDSLHSDDQTIPLAP